MQETKTKKSNRTLFPALICGIIAIIIVAVVIAINVISSNSKADLVGTWKIKSLAQKEKKYDESALGKVEFNDGSITFNEDSTGIFSETGQNATAFKYDKEKASMTIGDETIELHVSGKTLTLNYKDIDYTFEK